MYSVSSNLFYKVLKNIIDRGVNSKHFLALSLEISEELLDIVLESLLEKGYLKLIDEKEFKKEASLHCKFCPFANTCTENLPTVFYELSEKGKIAVSERSS